MVSALRMITASIKPSSPPPHRFLVWNHKVFSYFDARFQNPFELLRPFAFCCPHLHFWGWKFVVLFFGWWTVCCKTLNWSWSIISNRTACSSRWLVSRLFHCFIHFIFLLSEDEIRCLVQFYASQASLRLPIRRNTSSECRFPRDKHPDIDDRTDADTRGCSATKILMSTVSAVMTWQCSLLVWLVGFLMSSSTAGPQDRASDNFTYCHTWDRAGRPWLLSQPVTLYWHRPNQLGAGGHR